MKRKKNAKLISTPFSWNRTNCKIELVFWMDGDRMTVGENSKRTCKNPHIDIAHKMLHWITVLFVYDVLMWFTIRWIAWVNENVGISAFSAVSASLVFDFSMMFESQLPFDDIFFACFSVVRPFVCSRLTWQLTFPCSIPFRFASPFEFE